MESKLRQLSTLLEGEFYWSKTMRSLYATDASAYRELPLAVAIPKTEKDIEQLIRFANENGTSLIPRTAGTSLAGQVVGNGIVVDVSKHFNRVLEVSEKGNWVRVQPGVIRDDLNKHLKNHSLFFGPETSTANRAMIGGMIGNNSCGSNSMVYGSTRDHLLEVTGYLSDGSKVTFQAMKSIHFFEKKGQLTLEGKLYESIFNELIDEDARTQIYREFPKSSIPRRNTGYAIDLLMDTSPFTDAGDDFNFCKLIAGSEGTLMFITEAKLHVNPLPPPAIGLVCGHFNSIHESLLANLVALDFNPSACELMDHYVLECTKGNILQRENRFFVEGDPAAVLVVELRRGTQNEVDLDAQRLITALKQKGLGYHYPVVTGADTNKVWTLRKAGLGLLSNIPGDAKPVPVIEDTAVDVYDLPNYIDEFNAILKKHDLYCVHYAHAGSGELHLRPIIDLKTETGNRLFKTIADEIAALVKKYKGSLSGEHGDGRLRGEYIPFMIGRENYELLKRIKKTWDPKNIFNPGKIVDTPAMNTSLRYVPGQATPEFDTLLDFSDYQGIVRSAELCNGSGDCRKSELSAGTMCPSYMATRNEKDTTRARANILREVLTHSREVNPFASEEIREVMDLCLSCKGCKSECPSNVDVGKLKAEATYQYYKSKPVPLRTRMIASFDKLNRIASLFPSLNNFIFKNQFTSSVFKSLLGFAQKRSIPLLHSTTLKSWYNRNRVTSFGVNKPTISKKVYLFCDEFTNYNDVPIGIKALQVLTSLGYEVIIPEHVSSGRTYLSKGLLAQARTLAERNIELLHAVISEETPLIGIEPSAILTFRDEYIDLTRGEMKARATQLARHAFTFEEFIAKERDNGSLKSDQFSADKRLLKVHGHCHQKALSTMVSLKKTLTLPSNYEVHMIPSGCCGMAGSFGYEEEHYETSMKVGELILFPAVRKLPEEATVVAPGTSCRHQVKDGTGRIALHPVEVLHQALRNHSR